MPVLAIPDWNIIMYFMGRLFSVFCFLMVQPFCLVSQIEYMAKGRSFPEEQKYVDLVPDMVRKDPEKDTVLAKIMQAFRRTDLYGIKENLSVAIQNELPRIDSIMEAFEQTYKGIDSIYLYEHAAVSFSTVGSQGRTEFTHKHFESLTMEYQYVCGDETWINKITINDKVFPNGITRVEHLNHALNYKQLSDQQKYETAKELAAMLTIREGRKINDYAVMLSPIELSRLNGKYSWSAIIVGKYPEAVDAALKALELYPANVAMHSYLALAYAQQGMWDEAKQEYLFFEDTSFRDAAVKNIFLKDLQKLEDLGIDVKFKSEILELLRVE